MKGIIVRILLSFVIFHRSSSDSSSDSEGEGDKPGSDAKKESAKNSGDDEAEIFGSDSD